MSRAMDLIDTLLARGIFIYVENDELKLRATPGSVSKQDLKNLSALKSDILVLLKDMSSQVEQHRDTTEKLFETIEGDRARLSFSQQRLWFIDQLQGGSPEYNMPLLFSVKGQFSLSVAQQVLSIIVSRHEILRTVYRFEGDAVYQQILTDSVFTLNKIAIPKGAGIDFDDEAIRYLVGGELERPFDLSKDLMLRGTFFHSELNECTTHGLLLLNMHHIAMDGWSLDILKNEFVVLYDSISSGVHVDLPKLECRYLDYSHWQRSSFSGDRENKSLDYWKSQLADLPAVHNLPLDFARPEKKTYFGKRLTFNNIVSLGDFNLLAEHFNLTPNMLIHGVVNYILAAQSNSSEIVIGIPVANRPTLELENVIGFFINTLVLRGSVDFSSLSEYLSHIKTINLNALEHKDVPFDFLVEQLRLDRSAAYTPVFQIMLTYESNYGLGLDPSKNSGSAAFEAIFPDEVAARFDLSINAYEENNCINLSWEYDTALFSEATIRQLNKYLKNMLSSMVSTPSASLSELNILDKDETDYLVETLNKTEKVFEESLLIHQYFERQALQTPAREAVYFEGESLDYQGLNERANQLAHWLRSQGIGPDKLVGLGMERSCDMVIAILATLKAGGAYVPLDPDYPLARLQFMVEEADLSLILTQQHLQQHYLDAVTATPVHALDTTEHKSQTKSFDTANLVLSDELNSRHLAYVIYTSGSTGQPKGVMVEHKALNNRITWMQNRFQLSATDRVLQKTPYSFDVSVWEFIWPLSYGATLVVAKPEGHKDPDYLSELIEKQAVTHLHFVPSMLDLYLSHQSSVLGKQVKQVYCSGEALSSHQVAAFYRQAAHVELHNLYGPTEAAIDVTHYACDAGSDDQIIPIGKPIQNIQLLVLDRQQRLCPRGVEGELYIAGEGLARGYLNQPALTAERFISCPLEARGIKGPLYRTGDLVSYLEDGNLEYRGRIDHQIKLRGFRIELGEIETRLSDCEAVAACVVTANRNALTDEMQLVGYVVPVENEVSSEQLETRLLSELRRSVPDYMVPSCLVFLDEMPLTGSGKIDRRRLPTPDKAVGDKGYVAPQTDTEKLVANVWCELLGLQEVGRHDNFFRLGGHSILVVKLIGELRKIGYSIDLKVFYGQPVLEQVASNLTSYGKPNEALKSAIPEGTSRITPQMLTVGSITQADIDHAVSRTKGGASNIADIYPISPPQEGILFHSVTANESDPYVLSVTINLQNLSAEQNLVDGLNKILMKHDMMRALILWQDVSSPIQVILKNASLPVFVHDVDETGKAASSTIENILQSYQLRLDSAPLMDLHIFREKSQSARIAVLRYHHLVADHMVLPVICREVLQCEQNQFDTTTSALSYKTFVASFYGREKLKTTEDDFFKTLFSGFKGMPPPFGINDISADTRIEERTLEINGVDQDVIRSISKEHGASPATFFHAIYGLILAALGRTDDVVFGTVMSGRQVGDFDYHDTVGLFINTIPIRINIANLSIAQFFLTVQDLLIAVTPHEQTSLSDIQKQLRLEGDDPLFTSLLNYRHASETVEAENGAGTGIEIVGTNERTNYPLSFGVSDLGDRFEISIKSDSRVASDKLKSYAAGLVSEFIRLFQLDTSLPAMTAILPVPLEELIKPDQLSEIGPAYEEVAELNFCAANYDIVQRFEDSVSRAADKNAIIISGRRLTFLQLQERSSAIATHLKKLGVMSGDRVAILSNRHEDIPINILAVLKLGATYVPVDTKMPASRINFICANAGVKVVLTRLEFQHLLDNSSDAAVVLTDSSDTEIVLQNSEETHSFVPEKCGDLGAYIIYTSGSTGKPKGVLTTRSNLNYFSFVFQDQLSLLHVEQDDCWLWNSAHTFDASIKGLVCLANGMTLVMPNDDEVGDVDALVGLIKKHDIEVFNSLPHVVEQVLDGIREDESLTLNFIVSGDQVSNKLWSELAEYSSERNLVAINAYGPTETTVNAAFAVITSQNPPNIGTPVQGTRCRVIDNEGRTVAKGIRGELVIFGPGVCAGYLDSVEASSASFTFNKGRFAAYKTGDIVSFNNDGYLTFHGRADRQVKVRGYRIELTEIELALTELTEIIEVFVDVQQLAEGQRLIVAYIVVEKTYQFNRQVIEAHVTKMIPDYMLPNRYVTVEKLPRTTTGKVDSRLLRTMGAESDELSSSEVQKVGTVEHELLLVWKEVLGLNSISYNDDFIELGGDSILSMQLVAKAKRKGISITVRDVFENRTIAKLAQIGSEVKVNQAYQKKVEGGQILLPVQRDFLALNSEKDNQFNQSVLLKLSVNISKSVLAKIVTTLIRRHDGLRQKFIKPATGDWESNYHIFTRPDLDQAMEYIDLEGKTNKEVETAIYSIGTRAQGAMDIHNGPMFKAVYFSTGKLAQDRLLLISHHLVVDAVSWRILIQDIQDYYQISREGGAIKPDPKTCSYQLWAQQLKEAVAEGKFLDEEKVWEKYLALNVDGIASDGAPAQVTELSNLQSLSFKLDATSTRALISRGAEFYKAEAHELLIAALVHAIQTLKSFMNFRILMEGHGRECSIVPSDLSETVGWFTTRYPLTITLADNNLTSTVNTAKQACRSIPNGGTGFAALRAYSTDISEAISSAYESCQLQFNYLGQFDQFFKDSALLSLDSAQYGSDVGEHIQVLQDLNLDCIIIDGELDINLRFCPKRYAQEDISTLGNEFVAALEGIVDLITDQEKSMPANISAYISMEELTKICRPLTSDQSLPAVFCTPPISGASLVYGALAEQLKEQMCLYGLQLPSLYSDASCDSVENVAAIYVSIVQFYQESGPYRIIGWSSGGTLAYELARQLKNTGNEIEFLTILDQPVRAPGSQFHLYCNDPLFKIEGLYKHDLKLDWDAVKLMQQPDAINYIASEIVSQGLKPDGVEDKTIVRHLQALVSFPVAMDRYDHPNSDLNINLIRAEQSEDNGKSDLGWREITSGQVNIVLSDGEHMDMVYEKHAKCLAKNILRSVVRTTSCVS